MAAIPPVYLSEHDEHWAARFAAYKTQIVRALGARIRAVEHIGSTAVPGLAAKPEIDILVGVACLDDADRCIEPLASIGFDYFQRFEEHEPERRYFRHTDWDSPTHQPLAHIHMVLEGSLFWTERLLFRNHLIAHPDKIREYEELKRTLAREHAEDRPGYSAGKEMFTRSVIDDARGGA